MERKREDLMLRQREERWEALTREKAGALGEMKKETSSTKQHVPNHFYLGVTFANF